jgi:hypothetical protein
MYFNSGGHKLVAQIVTISHQNATSVFQDVRISSWQLLCSPLEKKAAANDEHFSYDSSLLLESSNHLFFLQRQ